MRPDAEVEAPDRQIGFPDKVVDRRERGGWLWSKVDGAEADLATEDHRVVAWRRKNRRNHDSSTQVSHRQRQLMRVDLDNFHGYGLRVSGKEVR